MDGVFKHEVDKIWVGLDEIVEGLQVLEFFSLFFVEDIEVVLVGV